MTCLQQVEGVLSRRTFTCLFHISLCYPFGPFPAKRSVERVCDGIDLGMKFVASVDGGEMRLSGAGSVP